MDSSKNVKGGKEVSAAKAIYHVSRRLARCWSAAVAGGGRSDDCCPWRSLFRGPLEPDIRDLGDFTGRGRRRSYAVAGIPHSSGKPAVGANRRRSCALVRWRRPALIWSQIDSII